MKKKTFDNQNSMKMFKNSVFLLLVDNIFLHKFSNGNYVSKAK